MTTLQKGTLWVIGCLSLVFALSIGLSWYSYGYLDGDTVGKMAIMLLPIMGAAVIVMLWTEAGEAKDGLTPSRKAREAEAASHEAAKRERS